ncbi:GerAB/ArcD/ProY family transporter [Paenibacillus silvisoli]|uniref:GerAB/ArcD/ProY family transporter n=1 Tax=Paenibacillus silvisoli TaxID=3110539 RepID=UPI0028062DDC|nr:GerAB/ArcD/ProY family transporter [Paenibacillus silvisoli]
MTYQDRLTPWQLFYIVSGMLGSFNFYLRMDKVNELSGTSTYVVFLVVSAVIGLLCLPIPAVMTNKDGNDFVASHLAAFGKIVGVPVLLLLTVSLILTGGMMMNQMMILLDHYHTPHMQHYWTAILLMLVCSVFASNGGVRVFAGLFFVVICTRLMEMGLLLFGISPYFELRSLLPLWGGIPKQPAAAVSNTSAMYTGIEVLVFLRLYTAGLKPSAVRGSIWAAIAVHCAFLMIGSWSMIGIFGMGGIRLSDLTTIDYYKLMSYPFFEQMDEVGICIYLFWVLASLSVTLWIIASLLRKAVFRGWPTLAHDCIAALLLLAAAYGLWEMRLTQLLQKWQPIILLLLLCVYFPAYRLLHAKAMRAGDRAPAGGKSL